MDRGRSWACEECGTPVEFVVEPGYEYNDWYAVPTCTHRIGGRDDTGMEVVEPPEDLLRQAVRMIARLENQRITREGQDFIARARGVLAPHHGTRT